jgi:hypothetical protein
MERAGIKASSIAPPVIMSTVANQFAKKLVCLVLLAAVSNPAPAQPSAASSVGAATSGSPLEGAAVKAPSPTGAARRKAIAEKLSQIQADLPAGNISLTNLVRTLATQAKVRDPEGRGINFIISAQGSDLDRASVKFGPDPVAGMALANALKLMVWMADLPILYTIEDYGVVIAPRKPNADSNQTRLIKANPDTFKQGLEGIPRANAP